MAVEERARRELQEALMSVIGPDPTDTLLGYLPPTGWADVATTRDVQASAAELRGEMKALRSELGSLRTEFGALRSELGALRSDVHAECSELGKEMHHALRTQFYWLVSLLFAVLALAGGILVSVLARPW